MNGAWIVKAEWDDSRPSYHGTFPNIATAHDWIHSHLDDSGHTPCDECLIPGTGENTGAVILRLRTVAEGASK